MKIDIDIAKWIVTVLVLIVLAVVIKKYFLASQTSQGTTTLM